MTKKLFKIFAFGFATLTVALTLTPIFAAEPTLKTATYNVHNVVGLDGKRDYDRIAETIFAENVDVVALQELDCKTKRSGGLDVLAELATRTKMFGEFGPAIDFQGGQYGIGVLSKEKPLKSEHFPLPGREEKRCLLVVEFEKYVFCCSHWSLNAEDRAATAKIITEKAKTLKKPVILCGDFNATPEEESMKTLAQTWTILTPDAPTFPADEPEIRIDYICGFDPTGQIDANAWADAVVSARVVDEPVASDHAPVVVEISSAVF